MLPLTPTVTTIDNDISVWISRDDPIYRTYERFRQEFGGQRTLIDRTALRAVVHAESLAFVRQVTDDIDRVDTRRSRSQPRPPTSSAAAGQRRR